MKTIVRFVLAVVVLLGMVGVAPTANAQQPPAPNAVEAQDRYKRGIELYEEENFAAALIEFRRAYELVPAFQVLYNVGRTCYQLRDYTCALKTFDRYLADGAGQVDAHRREEVEKEMVSLRRRIVTVTLTATRGSTIVVDSVPIGEAPLPGPLQVNEGRRLLRATMQGHEAVERQIEAVGGDTLAVDLTLHDAPTTTTPPAGTSRSTTPWWLFGTAGVLAVGAGVFGGLALSASSDASDIRKNGGSISDYNSDQSRMRTFSVTTDILALLAIGAGVTAVVITVTSKPSATEAHARVRDLRFTF